MGLVVKPGRWAPAVVNRLVQETGQGFRSGLASSSRAATNTLDEGRARPRRGTGSKRAAACDFVDAWARIALHRTPDRTRGLLTENNRSRV